MMKKSKKEKLYTADELLAMFEKIEFKSTLSEKERNILEEYQKNIKNIASKEDVKSMVKAVYPRIVSTKIHEIVKNVSYGIGCLELDNRYFTMLYNPSYNPEIVEIVEIKYNKFTNEIDPASIRSLTFGEDGTEDETEIWVIMANFFTDRKFLEITGIVYIDEISDELKIPSAVKNISTPLLRPKRNNKPLYKLANGYLDEIIKKSKIR